MILTPRSARVSPLDAAVARAEFDEVWAVLLALQEQDEVLAHPRRGPELWPSPSSPVASGFRSFR